MELLGYRIYPEPSGTKYYENDLNRTESVKILFDYCQILEAVIYEAGWNYLIANYGYELLLELERESGWFMSSDIDELKENIDLYLQAL
jgi:hypothetical protein